MSETNEIQIFFPSEMYHTWGQEPDRELQAEIYHATVAARTDEIPGLDAHGNKILRLENSPNKETDQLITVTNLIAETLLDLLGRLQEGKNDFLFRINDITIDNIKSLNLTYYRLTPDESAQAFQAVFDG